MTRQRMKRARVADLQRTRSAVFAAFMVVATSAAVVIEPTVASVSAATGCNLYADPAGNDANSGATPALAKRSPIALLNALAPGQTGCLTNGANFTLGAGAAITSTGGTVGAPKTLRPTTPGQRSTITTTTGFWFTLASHDIVLKDLDIRRLAGSGGSLMMVDGDRITLDGLDLTYPSNICLDVGDDARVATNVDPTQDFVLRNSVVHGCGSAYGPPREPNDSGVHGIYLQFIADGPDADAFGAIIEDNEIINNHNRGLQLYPQVDDIVVRHNILYGNGANLNLGSQLPVVSERNLVTNNIIAESTLDGLEPGGFVGDQSEVHGNLPANPNPGNRVEGNCIHNSVHPDKLYSGVGYTRVGNIENQDPQFVDAASGDFRLFASSPCVGKGPRRAVVNAADLELTIGQRSGNSRTGSVNTSRFIIRNVGNSATPAWIRWAVVGNVNTTGERAISASGARCETFEGQTICGTSSLAPGATFTVAVRVALVAPGSYSVQVTVAPTKGGIDVEVSAGATVRGVACSVVGTLGNDVLVGTPGSDTICGFDGTDSLLPGRGDDDVIGGAGNDTVSYASASAGVVIDLNQQAVWDVGAGTSAGSDELRGIEHAIGGAGADQLVGSASANRLEGGRGPDVISGGDGNDALFGGDGADVLSGGTGDDTFDGGTGTDRCAQNAGTGTKVACES